ncbi:MAG: pyrimidine dimer DNA glycosylase/endonuclease V [Candidatus Nitrosotenuis sp.]
MRVWDVPPSVLCKNHLLGEHREIHAIWSILTTGKRGYLHHPETIRWKGKLNALYLRHSMIADEMIRRGYEHKSPLDRKFASGSKTQTEFVDPPQKQIKILRRKNCDCRI